MAEFNCWWCECDNNESDGVMFDGLMVCNGCLVYVKEHFIQNHKFRNLDLLKNTSEIPRQENPLPICPRLIDLYADFLYTGGYKIYDIQTASVDYRRMMYKSFLSTLKPEDRQLTIYDQIELAELI